MTEYRLFFDDNIIKLEQERNWKEAVEILYTQWKINLHNINSLLCLGTELWYMLLVEEYQRFNPNKNETYIFLDKNLSYERLMEVTRFAINNFSENPVVNSYFGYMIKVMPYFFTDYNGDYDYWHYKGCHMIKYAYNLEPNNPFVRAMYYELDSENEDLYRQSCSEFWDCISLDDWGNSAVQKYFSGILLVDIFSSQD